MIHIFYSYSSVAFTILFTAYETLADEKKRRAYDAGGYSNEHFANDFDFDAFFRNFQESNDLLLKIFETFVFILSYSIFKFFLGMKMHTSAHMKAHMEATGGIFEDLWEGFGDAFPGFVSLDDFDHFGSSGSHVGDPASMYSESVNAGGNRIE